MPKMGDSFPPLLLPAADLKIMANADERPKVFDFLRRKYVALTPEEWVRQHFVHFLINHRHFPSSLIANEVSLKLYSTERRADTVVYDRTAKPLMIVEYKAPDIAVTERVFEQAVRYNIVLKAKYLVVTNGLKHICCRLADGETSARFLENIPLYEEL